MNKNPFYEMDMPIERSSAKFTEGQAEATRTCPFFISIFLGLMKLLAQYDSGGQKVSRP